MAIVVDGHRISATLFGDDCRISAAQFSNHFAKFVGNILLKNR